MKTKSIKWRYYNLETQKSQAPTYNGKLHEPPNKVRKKIVLKNSCLRPYCLLKERHFLDKSQETFWPLPVLRSKNFPSTRTFEQSTTITITSRIKTTRHSPGATRTWLFRSLRLGTLELHLRKLSRQIPIWDRRRQLGGDRNPRRKFGFRFRLSTSFPDILKFCFGRRRSRLNRNRISILEPIPESLSSDRVRDTFQSPPTKNR